MTPCSLEQRLGEPSQRGILRTNSPENPFWIPEENPLLRAWNMTLLEYCEAALRVTGLCMRARCQRGICAAWPDLEDVNWEINLIILLGNGYRLTHPDSELEPSLQGNETETLGAEEELCYVPDSTPPKVWVRWKSGAARNTVGDSEAASELEKALVKLILCPFHAIEEKKRKDARRMQKGW